MCMVFGKNLYDFQNNCVYMNTFLRPNRHFSFKKFGELARKS